MKSFKLMAVAVILLSSTANAAQFGGLEEVTGYLAPHYFQWEEFAHGNKLLREQGWLIGAGALARVNLLKGDAGALMLTGRAELFGGIVDYDGQTQSTNNQGQSVTPLPVKTDVNYFGTREEVDLGWRIRQQQLAVEPFFGFGARWWLRDIQDSTAFDPAENTVKNVSGYTEDWSSLYLRLGGRVDLAVNDDWHIFSEGGAKYPFYTENTADIAGDITLKPDAHWSAFAEAGTRYKKLKISGFYEGFRFNQSPGVVRGNTQYFQPISKSDIFGLRVGWAFR